MPRKLKVFRTPAGFHDAYVAAPSRKAALAAWGASADLFARGAAEEVTDPALMEAPLAAPGQVVKRSRGSAAEQLAAAPAPRRAGKPAPRRKKAAAPVPRPSRTALDAAEAALDAAAAAAAAERKELAKRRAALEREEKTAEQRWRTEQRTLEEARDHARALYDTALAKWRE
ncbi:hypothetical protein GCM10022253_31470 [Sphingomonas endophytica]|uniref:Type IV secretory pathway VirB10-like protein n=1 Tax=Sphingomonas endophytica TaxID=869719 RepID=A0ABR6N6F7_9SPHN|nr:hypothetical protein [Sphingomonas endophytica]MBB5726099.1 type IV secretory pathway VirB10-like protein [Sphingomonas endophytica]